MSAQPGCFEYIIGLSRTDCPCLDTDKPVDAAESASGYYIDEGEFLNMEQLKGAATCPEFWDWLERSRTLAVQDYKRDVLSCIRSNTTYAREPMRGVIGEDPESPKLLTMDKTYHGLTLQTDMVVGGTMTVYRIALKINTSGPVDIEVYNRDGLMITYTVTAVADTLTWYELTTPLELEMDSDGLNPRYWFLWQPTTERAYNTRIHCNCLNGTWKPTWDCSSPYYGGRSRKGFEWSQWVMATGTKGDDLSTRVNWKTTNETQGILLDARFNCDASTTICFDDPDYTDPIQNDQARAVLLKSWYYLLSFIKNSSNPSFWTLLNLEGIHESMSKVKAEYIERVEFVCAEFSKSENVNLNGDCLKCKDQWGFAVKTIKA